MVRASAKQPSPSARFLTEAAALGRSSGKRTESFPKSGAESLAGEMLPISTYSGSWALRDRRSPRRPQQREAHRNLSTFPATIAWVDGAQYFQARSCPSQNDTFASSARFG